MRLALLSLINFAPLESKLENSQTGTISIKLLFVAPSTFASVKAPVEKLAKILMLRVDAGDFKAWRTVITTFYWPAAAATTKPVALVATSPLCDSVTITSQIIPSHHFIH